MTSFSYLSIAQRRESPLHLASHNGHSQAVQLLHQYGADIHATNKVRLAVPAMMMALGGKSVNDPRTWTLKKACYCNVESLVLSYKALIYTVDQGIMSTALISCTQWGDTPLHVASSAGQTETVRSLLQLGADAGATNEVLLHSSTQLCLP